MSQKQRRVHGPAFTVTVGHFPHGSFPDHNQPVYQNPPPLRQAVTYQAIDTDGADGVQPRHVHGLLDGAKAVKTVQLTVDDNDFSTGPVVITLGLYELVSGVDYAIGAAAANTAVNLAAAIDNLPGYTAPVPAGVVVDVSYDLAPADEVEFLVVHHGTIINFTPIVPDDGFMANGAPAITAPALI
jgi:hypothetical protein